MTNLLLQVAIGGIVLIGFAVLVSRRLRKNRKQMEVHVEKIAQISKMYHDIAINADLKAMRIHEYESLRAETIRWSQLTPDEQRREREHKKFLSQLYLENLKVE